MRIGRLLDEALAPSLVLHDPEVQVVAQLLVGRYSLCDGNPANPN
jgi:hypothetical protein